MDEYAEAKFRVFANQGPGDTFVGNLDDPIVAALAEPGTTGRIPARAWWYALAPHRMTTLYVRDERITFAPPTGDPRPVEIMPVSEIALPGRHNVSNVLAALSIGLAYGLDGQVLREAVRAFKGLPHRLQLVATVGDVDYVDDSKSTNPGSVVAALESFSKPVILIAGGKSKRTDFTAMGRAIRAKAKAVVLIGEAAEEIAGVIDRPTVARASGMEEAVAIARGLAEPGDVVLLSPGCASFDMFSSAEHRGDEFTRVASALALARG
jgi:UDP-N-acetylmuramoylalanine--D-glutamate ligase